MPPMKSSRWSPTRIPPRMSPITAVRSCSPSKSRRRRGSPTPSTCIIPVSTQITILSRAPPMEPRGHSRGHALHRQAVSGLARRFVHRHRRELHREHLFFRVCGRRERRRKQFVHAIVRHLWYTGGRHAHHAGVAGQNLIPSVAFKPLHDYVVPVTVSLAQGTDSKIEVYYSASIQSGAAPATDVACTPASEIISVGALKVTRPVVIHCFGQSGGLTFTARAKSLDYLGVPSLVSNTCTSAYNVPAAAFHAAPPPGPLPAGVAAAQLPSAPSGLTVSCGPIAATNQYVAAVSFPVEAAETHIRAFFHATDAHGAALDVFPDSSSFNVTVGIMQTQNVLIDLSSNPTAPITFTVDGVATHAGAFFLQPSPTFMPQAQ